MASFSNLLAPARSVSQQVPLSKVGTQPISRLAPIPAPVVRQPPIAQLPVSAVKQPVRVIPDQKVTVRPGVPGYVAPTPAPVPPPSGGGGKGMPGPDQGIEIPGSIRSGAILRQGPMPTSEQQYALIKNQSLQFAPGSTGEMYDAYINSGAGQNQDFGNWLVQNYSNQFGFQTPNGSIVSTNAPQGSVFVQRPGQSMMGPSPGPGGNSGGGILGQPVYTGGIGLGNPPSITDNNPGQSMMGPSLSTGGGGGILSSNTNMNNGFISSNYSQPSNNMYGTNTNTNSTGKGMSSNNQSSGGTGKSM